MRREWVKTKTTLPPMQEQAQPTNPFAWSPGPQTIVANHRRNSIELPASLRANRNELAEASPPRRGGQPSQRVIVGGR